MTAATGNTAKPNSSANPTPTPSQTLTIGFVALQRSTKESLGETRGTRDRHAGKLVPIRVRSIAVDGPFIPLAQDITLSTSTSVAGVTFRPVRGAEIALPEEKGTAHAAASLEFSFDRIPAFGLVRNRSGQLMLADMGIDAELSLPPDFELVGVVAAPVGTHSLSVYDKRTDELYQLGYVFPNTIQPNWVELAMSRRDQTLAERAAERRQRETEKHAELEAEARAKKAEVEASSAASQPAPTFATSDLEVVYRLKETYAARYLRPINVFRPQPGQFLVEDPENFGPSIAENVASERATYGDEADVRFEREREARDYAASVRR
jgi:hypothetical protein